MRFPTPAHLILAAILISWHWPGISSSSLHPVAAGTAAGARPDVLHTISYPLLRPPAVRFRFNPALRHGHYRLLDEGKPQVQVVTVQGGQPAQITLARPGQPRVVELGAPGHYLPGRTPYHPRYARAYHRQIWKQQQASMVAQPVSSLRLIATGYTSRPEENGGFRITATGLPIGYGAAAVDPRVIPLGTRLYVEGYGYAMACDTGGAIKGPRIDLAFDEVDAAYRHGRRPVRVWLLS